VSTSVESAAPQFRSARDIFGGSKAELRSMFRKREAPEIPQWAVNLLQSGCMMMKHSMHAPPRKRHVYFTQDLEFLIWKDPSTSKEIKKSQMMKAKRISGVSRGRTTPQLLRTKTGHGDYFAAEDKAFSVIGVSLDGEDRTVDLETNHSTEREQWCRAIEAVIEHHRAVKNVAGSDAFEMTDMASVLLEVQKEKEQ